MESLKSISKFIGLGYSLDSSEVFLFCLFWERIPLPYDLWLSLLSAGVIDTCCCQTQTFVYARHTVYKLS